jgi:hypothetical protein
VAMWQYDTSTSRWLAFSLKPMDPICCGIAVVITRSLQRLLLHRRVVCVCVFLPPVVKGELLLDMRYGTNL